MVSYQDMQSRSSEKRRTRRYWNELTRLAQTYEFASSVDLGPLPRLVDEASSTPLVVIGSGGSYSAATFICQLHERFTGQVARCATPLEVIEGRIPRAASIWCISAGGRNRDILGAFGVAAKIEPRNLAAFCASKGSPLAKLAKQFQFTDIAEFSLPTGKDGFLATNSLLATALLAARAYHSAANEHNSLPPSCDALIEQTIGIPISKLLDGSEIGKSLHRKTLSIIFSSDVKAAAIDLESRAVEAALTEIQIADFRNFAHGRHLWLAKHDEDTAVLALVSDAVKPLAERTLKLLPKKVPIARWDFTGSLVNQGISGLLLSIHIVNQLGENQGKDPSRPGVPPFGRKVYHLRPTIKKRSRDISANEQIAIFRKTGISLDSLKSRDLLGRWRNAYDSFTKSLNSQVFAGIVFDFDGTLCDPRNRFEGIDTNVATALLPLLSAGIPMAVVTGRGKSARDQLRDSVPKRVWKFFIIGYYNGGVIGGLSDDSTPKAGNPAASLEKLKEAIEKTLSVEDFELEMRRSQLSILPARSSDIARVWQEVSGIVARTEDLGLQVYISSHSVDVIPDGISKRSIFEALRITFGISGPLLAIGDRGQWPGNDYALLANELGLSVDQVNCEPQSCWNLAPPGHRGVQATTDYLNAMQPLAKGQFRFLV